MPATEKALTKFTEVSKASPCVICGKDHKCSRGEDGLILCGRTQGPVPGYVYLGQAKADIQWALYRVEGDSTLTSSPQPFQCGRPLW
jgi:hypothetical protein